MSKLIITRGLPGSGKSTLAKGWVQADPRTRARVNRDALRGMLHDHIFVSPLNGVDGTETAVTTVRNAAISVLLKLGKDVICDDTNLPNWTIRELCKVAAAAGAQIEVWDLTDVPLEECLRRNALRDGQEKVPDYRIREMYERFIEGKMHPLPIPDTGGES